MKTTGTFITCYSGQRPNTSNCYFFTLALASEEEINYWYHLYQNVKKRSFELNTFDLPLKFFKNALHDSNWEILQLSLKNEFNDRDINRPVAVGLIYKGNKAYCPMVLGLDYYYLYTFKNYRQAIFQVIKRANVLGYEKMYLGFTATIEKQRFGAKAVPKVAYMQSSDTYSMAVLEMSKIQERSEKRAKEWNKYLEKERVKRNNM